MEDYFDVRFISLMDLLLSNFFGESTDWRHKHYSIGTSTIQGGGSQFDFEKYRNDEQSAPLKFPPRLSAFI